MSSSEFPPVGSPAESHHTDRFHEGVNSQPSNHSLLGVRTAPRWKRDLEMESLEDKRLTFLSVTG